MCIEKFLWRATPLDRIAWRNLVGVSHTLDEVNEAAKCQDRPDETGKIIHRPGKPSGYLPGPDSKRKLLGNGTEVQYTQS